MAILTGVSGYFDVPGKHGSGDAVTGRIHYTEYYDVTTNKSYLAVSLQIASSEYSGVTYYPNGPLSVGGTPVVTFNSVTAYHNVRLSSTNTFCDVVGDPSPPWASAWIDHAEDGSGSVKISLNITGELISNNTRAEFSISGEKMITLTTIPRASTIGATDANIGAVSMIAVARKSTAYTHSIHYKFGNLSGYITAAGGTSASEVKISDTSIAFTVPTSFYAQIPNAKSGGCELECRTYSGNTQIGSTQTAKFTVTAAESANKPSVSGTVVDINETTIALTGDANRLVRFCSTALAAISSHAKNSATIVSETVNGKPVTDGQVSFPAVEQNAFTFAAQDSRGYSGTAVVTKQIVPYVRLSCNPTGQRTDPTSGNAVLTIKGNYYNGSFGAVDNTLQISYAVDGGEPVTVTPAFVKDTYSAEVALSGLDYNTAHAIKLTVADKLSTLYKKATVEKGVPIFDWGENDFQMNVDLYVNEALIIAGKSFLDRTYPVGSIYISTVETSPADLFGGTWQRLKDRFLLAAGDTYTAGRTGGSSVTYHRHESNTGIADGYIYADVKNGDMTESVKAGQAYAVKAEASTITTTVRSNTDGTYLDNMPPYLAVYMWQRI